MTDLDELLERADREVAVGRGYPVTVAELAAAVRVLRDRPCPHIETGDDGTAFCTLAESANTAWADRAAQAEAELRTLQVRDRSLTAILRGVIENASTVVALLDPDADRPGGTNGEQRARQMIEDVIAEQAPDSMTGGFRPGGTDNPTSDQPVCRTCANSGWVGSRHDPKDCPTCGRKPYFLNGGTYPAPAPTGDDDDG